MPQGLPAADSKLKKGRFAESILSPLTPGKLLDVGAGKGTVSLTAAGLGWHVTAVNAATLRWAKRDVDADPEPAALLDSITFMQADVRQLNIDRHAYDLICITGLHDFDVPDQVALVRKCAGTPLLIDARIASAPIDAFGDYRGMLSQDHSEAHDERDETAAPPSRHASAFLHTEESLVRLLRDCGYPIVFQARPPYRQDHTFYFALPIFAAPD
ncbi:MAG: class I SAM-dependent methyltransferase [Chloroflexota bacterium]|nr:class I SAM-dependent methyltransferase [Chloroflexota bacterium]